MRITEKHFSMPPDVALLSPILNISPHHYFISKHTVTPPGLMTLYIQSTYFPFFIVNIIPFAVLS